MFIVIVLHSCWLCKWLLAVEFSTFKEVNRVPLTFITLTKMSKTTENDGHFPYLGLRDSHSEVMKISVFWNIMSCSLKVDWHFAWACCFHLWGWTVGLTIAACFILVLCLARLSTLSMEVICSSEMLADFHKTTWHCIPQDRSVQVLYLST
jgi:hypothetical protein